MLAGRQASDGALSGRRASIMAAGHASLDSVYVRTDIDYVTAHTVQMRIIPLGTGPV